MAGNRLHRVIGQLRREATALSRAAMTDAQLLHAFQAGADEAAFEALLRRHGPMVLSVCRRFLAEAHDAEDAFQATFIVLVRRAHAIAQPERLASWLYGVACRTARKSRGRLARQRCRERALTNMDQPTTFDREPGSEVAALLDDAMGRLPEKYRSALVLCELQGRSRQQAAQLLGLAEGTLSSRLARGRQMLARLLSRRGLALSGGALAAALAEARAGFGLPPTLLRSTVRAALAARVALALIFAPTALLTEGVHAMMTSAPCKIALAILVAVALLAAALSPWPGAAEQTAEAGPAQDRPAPPAKEAPLKHSVILLWMSGGPSQLDTFDLKPGQANGGPFKEIDTNVKGIRISEHLPKVAKFMDKMVLIRGMTHREGDHQRATHLMHTGYAPQQGLTYPTLGEILAKELGGDKSTAPNRVRTAPAGPLGTPAGGNLGARYSPLVLGNGLTLPENGMFIEMATDQAEAWHKTMKEAVDLSKEKEAVRNAYGTHRFGDECLVARRLVERRVPVVEITLGGWDTHADNFTAVKKLSEVLDAGWGTLMSDLKERKLLDSTLIVWMGEFGRTPRINGNNGRDHFPASFTVVLAGGGVKGGQVIGVTNADGAGVAAGAVSVPELFATIYATVGVDLKRRYPSNRKDVTIPIVDGQVAPIADVVQATGKK
jgi:RNA polymerase sigma factor (sigma-70 family)